jgi:PAS domain S-box-containing protein
MSDALAPMLPAVLDALSRANIGLIIVARRDNTYERLYANELMAASMGYTVEEWHAKQMFELVAPSKRKQIEQLYESLTHDGPMPPRLEVALVHRAGHEMLVEVVVGRVELAEGHGIALVARDIGPRQAELSLLEADRLALVAALASGFAHETNNPLTSVLLNLRSLRKQVVAHLVERAQGAALRCLDDITAGAERIASNVRALQTLATRGKTQTLDLAAVVSAALRLAGPTLEPRAHVIRQIFPVRAVIGEESRIGQAVLAMMLFSSSGFEDDAIATTTNRIVVSVEEREGHAIVEVSDNGREVSGEEAQKAFDPFFRSPGRGSGVGVGLGVARSVAASLGGEVLLAPRPGGGAVITMKLPLAPA